MEKNLPYGCRKRCALVLLLVEILRLLVSSMMPAATLT
jgi:hypothetical protein